MYVLLEPRKMQDRLPTTDAQINIQILFYPLRKNALKMAEIIDNDEVEAWIKHDMRAARNLCFLICRHHQYISARFIMLIVVSASRASFEKANKSENERKP